MSITRITAGLVGMIALTTLIAASQQKPTLKSVPPSAPIIPRLADRVVSEIQEYVRHACRFENVNGCNDVSEYELSGLSDYPRLYIASSRATIAFKTIKAVESHARYVPPASEREDSVIIQCGHHEFGEIFECSRVRVMNRDKKLVKATFYSAMPNAYRNALGARWTVREVVATYPIQDLRDGFFIDYASFDGTEWTFEVSAEDEE